MILILVKPFQYLGNFLSWWGVEVPRMILIGTRNLLVDFDDSLRLGANLRLWLALEPLFGDYTWSGRAVGFLMRGIRLIATLAAYALVLAIGMGLVFSWWLVPVLVFNLHQWI